MRLKDVAFVNLRTLDESTKGDYKFRYIDISSVSADNGIILGDEITFQEAPSRARRIVKKDDVLVSTVRTYLRAIANIDWDAKDIIASTGFAVYTPNNKIIPRFLAYSIKSTKAINQICSNSKGVSYPAIQAQVLSSIEIPYWDLKRQEAIAAYLDKECEKIGRKIELLERKADVYSRLRRSLINRAVTRGLDPNVSLKPSGNNWIGDIPQHWGYERVEKYFHNNTSYNKDFQYKHAFKFFKGTIIHKDETFEEDEYQDTYEKYTIVEPNDIIINGLNLNYDLKSMRVGKVTENGIITSAYIVLRPYNNVCSDFFNYLFKAFDYRKFFHGMGKGIRLTLSFNELRYFEIPIPPIDEQKKIAAYLDEKCAKIDAILEKINTEVELLKELKRSLINEVVTGQRAIDTELHS